MLTFKPDYIFLFDSRLERLRRDNYFFRGRLAVASNRVYSSPQGLFDVQDRLSRFVQIESDIRYFSIPNQKNTLALRLLANVSAPLGGEIILPFLDLYTVGGPTSVRAYTLREVGPGGLPVDSAGLQFFRGRGDIQLETSLEYRYRASSMLELAAFVDAGNVWFFGEDSAGGVEAQFRLERFHRDLAVGAGLGLRFHLSILVLRLDFAAPLADPRLPLGQRWVGNRINSLSDFRFNFAFGYPF
jgi:outer membrane protein assembly factor BamA